MSFALAIAAAAQALTPFADLDALDRRIAAFTGAPAGAEGGAVVPLDRRLRLTPCRAPVALSWRGERRDAVVVQCGDAGSWRLFVPLRSAPPPAFAAPVVNRGDMVTIAVAGTGFSVSQPGEALDSGAAGAWIRVRAVNGKGDPMRAKVLRPGLVGLLLPE